MVTYTRTNKNLFRSKAKRYANAMAKLPYARIMELAWVNWFMPHKKGAMLDIMGGTGFVSDSLSPVYSKAVVLDSTKEILPLSSSGRTSIAGDACDNSVIERFVGQFDLSISLGGFHHVAHSEQQTESIIKSWAKTLKQDGRLIIADVPKQGISQKSILDVAGTPPEILKATEIIPKWDIPYINGSFQDWYLSLRSALDEIRLEDAEPASFFDSVVTSQCPNGHDAYFQDVDNLKNIFRKVGLKDVSGFVISTPWLFENKRQATWFIHELFDFGKHIYESPEVFPKEQIDNVLGLIKDFLGYAVLSNGYVIIGWKLMVVMGDKY